MNQRSQKAIKGAIAQTEFILGSITFWRKLRQSKNSLYESAEKNEKSIRSFQGQTYQVQK
jgi:hypothetical protein